MSGPDNSKFSFRYALTCGTLGILISPRNLLLLLLLTFVAATSQATPASACPAGYQPCGNYCCGG
jgi:hypothetical protein